MNEQTLAALVGGLLASVLAIGGQWMNWFLTTRTQREAEHRRELVDLYEDMLKKDDAVFSIIREFNGRPSTPEGSEKLARAVQDVKLASFRIAILDRNKRTRVLAGRIAELMQDALGHGTQPPPVAASVSQAWRDAQRALLDDLEKRFGM
jgi:hypothetical protein